MEPTTESREIPSTRRAPRRERRSKVHRSHTEQFVKDCFGEDLHAKRVLSLANAVLGVMRAARLSIHFIGQAYSELADMTPRNGVKQVDRFLANEAIRPRQLLGSWAAFVIGPRDEVVVALDWTEFDDDDHATLAAYVVTRHGRATPLAWMTVKKSTLQGRRNDHEYSLIESLQESIPESVGVTLLADRGFGDQKLYALRTDGEGPLDAVDAGLGQAGRAVGLVGRHAVAAVQARDRALLATGVVRPGEQRRRAHDRELLVGERVIAAQRELGARGQRAGRLAGDDPVVAALALEAPDRHAVAVLPAEERAPLAAGVDRVERALLVLVDHGAAAGVDGRAALAAGHELRVLEVVVAHELQNGRGAGAELHLERGVGRGRQGVGRGHVHELDLAAVLPDEGVIRLPPCASSAPQGRYRTLARAASVALSNGVRWCRGRSHSGLDPRVGSNTAITESLNGALAP